MFNVAVLADATSSNLMAARQMMAFTLGTHILLASFGVAFPVVVLVAHLRGLRRGDAEARQRIGTSAAASSGRAWTDGVWVMGAIGAAQSR